MATKTVKTSDLSPDKVATKTERFTVNGKHYEIDLTEEESQAFLGLFAKYTEKGRPGKAGRRSKAASSGSKTPSRAGVIRDWAKGQGIEVGEKGRIPKEIIAKYDAAH